MTAVADQLIGSSLKRVMHEKHQLLPVPLEDPNMHMLLICLSGRPQRPGLLLKVRCAVKLLDTTAFARLLLKQVKGGSQLTWLTSLCSFSVSSVSRLKAGLITFVSFKLGDAAWLQVDHANQFDTHAVTVLNSAGDQLGFIAARNSRRQYIELHSLEATVVEVSSARESISYLAIKLADPTVPACTC